jgi:predicted enzyme related to lactoylglutathione lyase
MYTLSITKIGEMIMSIQSMDLAWIVVKDLKTAVTFYTDVVGLKVDVLEEQYGWAELVAQNGKMRLGIAQKNEHSDMEAGTNAVITLTVKNIEESKKDLLNKGAQLIGDIIEVPGNVKMQTLADKDGNRLQIVEILNKQ